MTRLRVALSRVLDVVLRRRRQARLDREIADHLALMADDLIARGMSAADAAAAARRAFGGVDRIKAEYRDQQGLPVLDAAAQDAGFALRLLRRDPGFTVVAVLVLGLGIGVNTMQFTVLRAHTMRGLPVHDVDRVVSVSTVDGGGGDRGLSYHELRELRDAAPSFAGIAGFRSAPVVVAGDGRAAERFEGTYTSTGSFALLGAPPLAGREFTQDDDRPGAARVVLLGRGAWESRYGADPSIVGRALTVDGSPATVVGIVSDRSGFPSTAAVWLPLAQAPGLASEPGDARTLSVFARLRSDRTIHDARGEADALAGRLEREHPDTNRQVRTRVVPINDRYLGRLRDPAWLAFMAAGALMVLISCANVANLLLGRAFHRAREIAIRTSLGATRRRVIRQLLMEGAVLAALGGATGLMFAAAGVRLFRSAIPENALPYWLDYSFDGRVVLALAAVSAATVLLFGLLPAIHASRTDVIGVLNDGGRTVTHTRGRRWTTAFLAAELALSVVLLSHLAVNIRTSVPPRPAEEAIDTPEILTAVLTLPRETYGTPDRRTDFFRRLEERLGGVPGIASTSLATAVPLGGGEEKRLEIAGRAPDPDAQSQPAAWTVAIGPRYFSTLGIALERGRELAAEDGTPGHANAIVNAPLAERFLPGENPIGRQIALFPKQGPPVPREWLTVVGVAPALRQRPTPVPHPIVYLPWRAAPPPTATLIVRSRTDAAALTASLRAQVGAIDANLPLYRVRTMARVLRDAQWNGRLSSQLFLVLTGIAVALATAGLYAVTAHGVSQRTHEIGVRMALGARPAQVLGLIVRRAALQLAMGFAAGIVLTRLWAGAFSSGRAEIHATDPISLLIVGGVLTVLALLACAVPARRAARLDPIAAIRRE